MPSAPIVIGVDVGGPSKGFHAVGLGRGRPSLYKSCDAREVAEWARSLEAQAVAVDAPCKWSATGRSRPCERSLMARRISCFSTPSESVALANENGFYGWMLAGQKLFNALSVHYALHDGERSKSPVLLETFPHAVVCALAGKVVRARPKGQTRRAALRLLRIDADLFPSIDFVDAALCAVAAQYFLRNEYVALGERDTGFIVTPWTEFLSI